MAKLFRRDSLRGPSFALPESGARQFLPEPGPHRGLPESGPRQRLPEPGLHQRVPEPGPHRGLPESGPRQRLPEPGLHQRVPEPGERQRVPEPGTRQSLPLLLPVLLPGWGFSQEIWGPVKAELGPSVWSPDLPGHDSPGYDLPGHDSLGHNSVGHSSPDHDWPDHGWPDHGWPDHGSPEHEDSDQAALWADLPALGAALCAPLAMANVEPVWIGWSLGGLAALAAAAHWSGPQRLVLVAGTPRFVQAPDWSAAMPVQDLEAFAQLLAEDRALLERRFVALCARGAQAPEFLRRVLRASMVAHPASDAGLRAGLDALRAGDLRSVWASIQAPVAAWLYADDALIPGGLSADLQRLRPDAKVVLRSGGHASWRDEPTALVAWLQEMMA